MTEMEETNASEESEISLVCTSPRRDWGCRIPGSAWQAFPFSSACEADADLMLENPEVGKLKFVHHVWYRRAEALMSEMLEQLPAGLLECSLIQNIRQTVAGEPAVVLEYQGIPAGQPNASYFISFSFVRDNRLYLVIAIGSLERQAALRQAVQMAMNTFTLDEDLIKSRAEQGIAPPEMPEGTLSMTPDILKAGAALAKRGGSCYWSDEYAFSFGLVDRSWSRSSDEEAQRKDCLMQFVHNRLGVFRVMVEIDDRDLADMQSATLRLMDRQFSDFRETSRGKLQIAGCPAVFVEGEGNVNARPFRFRTALFRSGPLGYQLLFCTDPANFGDLLEEMLLMLNSWQFRGPPPKLETANPTEGETVPKELMRLLRKANNDLDRATGFLAFLSLCSIGLFFVLDWWLLGFLKGLIATVVISVICFGVLGSIGSKKERKLFDRKYRDAITEMANSMGIQEERLSHYIKGRYKNINNVWK